ncbi:hypothetical protein ACQEUX_03230 [Micromonospora sp. CA-259024]|uniref:hypothetical protein n=1 Tax=Micromonospora sp. CA-259024 TaxID=3239965 RepID=UPI003D8EAA73
METATLQRYTDHLARHLVGPTSRRTEILDEVMDGLQCAAEDNLDTYPDQEEAARLAVLAWGAPGEVARAYNDATLRLSANRLSLQTVCVLPVLVVSWAFALLASPDAPWPQHPPLLLFGLSVAGLGGTLCLLGAVTGLRRGTGMRAMLSPDPDAAAAAALAALTGLICVLSAPVILLLNRGITHPESLNWHLVPFPAALTLVVGAYFVTSLRRFLFVVREVARPV